MPYGTIAKPVRGIFYPKEDSPPISTIHNKLKSSRKIECCILLSSLTSGCLVDIVSSQIVAECRYRVVFLS
jgi:hypothetical protein